MSILDISSAKPLQTDDGKRLFRPSRRTLSLQNNPALVGQGSGSGFAAAKPTRLTMDFIARSRSADQDLFGDNLRLRARARTLAVDNPHAKKFLQMLVQNVIGANGILMQSKVVGVNGNETELTKAINERINEEWKRWGRMGRCTADGKMTWVGVQQMAIKNCGREGENLTKFVYSRSFNETAMALQLLDNDQLDDTMAMQQLANGGEIRMGVEVDQYRRPQAYHLWSGHPNDMTSRNRDRKRIPAEDICHTAVWERPGQTRGYTWLSASMLSLNQYNRYEEAVTVAARASAAKFCVIEEDYPEGVEFGESDDEDAEGNGRNADGTAMSTANAGEMPVLEVGQHANFIDPRFPTTTHKDFTQTILRNVSSGLLVSYPFLANDLEGVNFSSIRAGLVDERDCWRVIQRWFIDSFCEPTRLKWLQMALLTTLSDITLTPAQMEQCSWRPRGWEWVDPLKDADAVVLKRGNGLTTYSRELANQGLDFDEITDELVYEQELLKRKGLTIGTDITGDQAGKGVAAGAEADAAEAEGGEGQQGGGKGKQQAKGGFK